MGFKLSSVKALLFCTHNILVGFAILSVTAQKANASIDNCKQLEASFETIHNNADEIRHVVNVMSKLGLSGQDMGKSILLEKIQATNKAVTSFQIQVFPCFWFLNTNRYPTACQNGYQAMGVVVGLHRKNTLKPAKEIANSSGNTESMIEDFLNSVSSTTRQINSNMNNVNENVRLCNQR
jgi:hypothetical protein